MSIINKYSIERIGRYTALQLLKEYHYIHEEGGNFRSGINFGLFENETNFLIGVCVFHTPSAKEIVKGCFGINSYSLDGFYELGRLCINPFFYEKNLTSFFLGNSIKLLRKIKKISAILTYADCGYHVGYIYQATNFKYYGLTDKKKDFFIINPDGTHTKLQRGKCRHLHGEWRDKNQKHRYLMIFDKNLKPIWENMPYPKGTQLSPFNYDIQSKKKQEYVPIERKQLKLFN